MTDSMHEPFQPGEHFPAGTPVPQRVDILALRREYGIPASEEIQLIDSTHSAEDIRLNYIVGKKWVLRFCNGPAMTEKRLQDLSRLIDRYRTAGILCPRFLTDSMGTFLHTWKKLTVYLSEYIDLPLASGEMLNDPEQLMDEARAAEARFARQYRNADLSETMGMYSLFDLSPFDLAGGIDEKQDNFNRLTALLREEREGVLADKLERRHLEIRKKLKACYRNLPRCVFQGDENFSNILVDENRHFAGFIDFNLAGTEVIVNQLANLAGFDYDEKNPEPEGAGVRLEHGIAYFREHMGLMLHIYDASGEELRALGLYAWIVMTAQWPVFCYFRACIRGRLKSEILEMLSLIAELPEEQLLP